MDEFKENKKVKIEIVKEAKIVTRKRVLPWPTTPRTNKQRSCAHLPFYAPLLVCFYFYFKRGGGNILSTLQKK